MRVQKMFLAVSMASMLAVSACGGEAEEPATDPAPVAEDAESEDMETEEMTSEDMAEETGDMAEETGDMAMESGDMAEETGDMAMESGDMAGETGAMDPAANLVGAGCADYAEAVPEGEGSVEGMAQDPVATAASNNPLLTTLTAAVSGELNPDVDLVDTLNGDEFTVFAPVDEAFAADIDAETLEALGTDADLLSSVLTYHVVPGQLTPEQVVGEQTTVQGGTLEVTGEGDNLMVNDANVICGGVQTANATVYLIDGVLMPTQ